MYVCLIFLQVKWIRALYSDFATFTKDQERLISTRNAFDYLEGFVVVNRTGLLNNWRSSFNPKEPILANEFTSEGKILFCLEIAKYFNPEDVDGVDRVRFVDPIGPFFRSKSLSRAFLEPHPDAGSGQPFIRTELHRFHALHVRSLVPRFPR